MKKLKPITPGEILLEEFLQPLARNSYNDLAKQIGVPANHINQIVRGQRELTADTALRLGRFFEIEPEFWLNLQMRLNMKIDQEKSGKHIEQEVKK